MAARQTNGGLSSHFNSMPNFRKLPSSSDLSSHELTTSDVALKLYRSSRPDFLTAEEVDQFLKLGIRSIIDFRSPREYSKATGLKLLDEHYPVFKVKCFLY